MSLEYDSQERLIVSGIYFLFKNGELIYVGKSNDVYKRISQHRSNGREFDIAIPVSVPSGQIDLIEKALIKATNPPQNRIHTSHSEKIFSREPLTASLSKSTAPADKLPEFSLRAFMEKTQSLTMSFTEAKNAASECKISKEFEVAVENGSLHFVVEREWGNHPNAKDGKYRRRVCNKKKFEDWLVVSSEARLVRLGIK